MIIFMLLQCTDRLIKIMTKPYEQTVLTMMEPYSCIHSVDILLVSSEKTSYVKIPSVAM